jgi:putative membrane protein insertion efficiency factor
MALAIRQAWSHGAAAAVIMILRFYQLAVSPWLGRNCRFEPSCSEYTREAVARYGAAGGLWRGSKRVLRCHPFHPGGFDPVR